MVVQSRIGERLSLSLEGWSKLGDTIATHNGNTVQVFGGIPGEEVVAEVVKERGTHIAARVIEVLRPSPHRATSPCRYFGECTGCQWQHVDYEKQLRIKTQTVIDALVEVGDLVDPPVSPCLGAPEQFGYRNHARFTARRDGSLGFVNRDTRRFVKVQECLLMHPWINDALGRLQDRCGETTQLSIRYGANTGDFLIQPTLKSTEIPLKSGQKHYTESVGGRKFRIASPSFFQVNTNQAELLVALVKEGLRLTGDQILVDAYAGVGTFAALLAPHVKKVIAIEEAASAVEDAGTHIADLENVEFIAGKTEEVLTQIDNSPDAIILDPPRVGCQPKALEAVLKLSPERIVYVSCDPPALARDLKVLCKEQYRLEEVRPIDMFPQTRHVECVAVLSLVRDTDGTGPHGKPEGTVDLVLALTSPPRRELTSRLGISYRVVPPQSAELAQGNETPEEMSERLALLKARSISSSAPASLIIGADTVVVLEGGVLGKPKDDDDARRMLRELRGREHQVVTGVAVIDASRNREYLARKATSVHMRDYSDHEIEAYVDSGRAADKAGAYGIQDVDFSPVADMDGCYTNVVGLPLCTLADLLNEAGIDATHVEVPHECSQCPLQEEPHQLNAER